MNLMEPRVDDAIRVVVEKLTHDFPDVDDDIVRSVAREAYDTIAARTKAPTFVGILAERRARHRLALIT